MTVQERERQWAERYTAYEASGQTKRAWCESNNIKVKSFYRWGRKLRDRKNSSRFVLAKEITENEIGHKKPNNIEITVGRATINVSNGFDTGTLKNVLQIVSGIC